MDIRSKNRHCLSVLTALAAAIGLFILTTGCVSGTNNSGHGGFGKTFDSAVRLATMDAQSRTYDIRIKNADKRELAIASVSISYLSANPRYSEDGTLSVIAEKRSTGNERISPGETMTFRADFPRVRELEFDSLVDKTKVILSIKAAAVDERGSPWVVTENEDIALSARIDDPEIIDFGPLAVLDLWPEKGRTVTGGPSGTVRISKRCVRLLSPNDKSGEMIVLAFRKGGFKWDDKRKEILLVESGQEDFRIKDGDKISFYGLDASGEDFTWIAPPDRSCQGKHVIVMGGASHFEDSSLPEPPDNMPVGDTD